MSQLLVSSGDVVFMPGEVPVPPQMFIVCSGELTYHYMSGAIAYVEVGHWISEATLWVNWVHQGMLKASSDCRLCRVDAAKFLDFTVRYDSDFEIRRYARALVGAMNSGEMELSDMPYHEDCEEIFEVIHHYERQKDPWGVGEATEVQQTAEESSGSRWKRLSSGSGGQEGDGKPAFQRKQSVLMVTPTAEKKKFWFW
uniref:Cyclic nucleotide-binding domain-containing protein n=1 Tax=Alexandrium andersonii TaxID=327968 RepID=A0A7S2MIW3_9DINO